MLIAERHEDHIRVNTEWRDKELIKLIPGSRWNSREYVWTLPLSWAACLQLRGVFGDRLTVGPMLTDWSWREFIGRVQPTTSLRDRLVPTGDSPDERAYPFQVVGSDMLLTGDSLNSDEMGLGKTVTALLSLSRLDVIDALPALVICPNSVRQAWKKHSSLWCPDATPYVLRSGAVTRRKILDQARQDPTALVIINIESVRLLSRLAPFGNVALKKCRECDSSYGDEQLTASRCEVHRKELNGFGFKTVIIDEAHRIKSPNSAQTRACWAVGDEPSVRRRWALTGTPIANSVADLWSIMRFVAPYEWPTKSKWVDRYALTSWNAFGGLDVIGINPQTRDEFRKIFEPRFRRTQKALVLDQLPKVIRSTRWATMVPKQSRAYKDIEKKLITRLDTGEVMIAPNQLTKATRLLQLSSAYADVEWVEQPLHVTSTCSCYRLGLDAHADDCPQRLKMVVTLTDPSPKIDVLEEIIEERGSNPLVIAAMSRQLIMLAAKRLESHGVSYGLIVGGMSDYERQRTIDNFRSDKIQAVLLTIQAGGTGVDGLQHSDTIAFLQRSWSMIDNVQTENRIHRIGSEKHDSVHVIDIVTQDTIEEEALFPRLQHKWEQLDEINRDRERLITAGLPIDETFMLEERIINSDLGAPV